MSVPEAASRLGVTQSAIRKRVQREQIPFDKDERGHTYVYLSPNELRDSKVETSLVTDHNVTGQDAMVSQNESLIDALRSQIDSLNSQVEFLQKELESRREESVRKDSIMAGLVQRVPELESVPGQRESAVSDSELESKGAVPQDAAEEQIRQSFWRRLLGG